MATTIRQLLQAKGQRKLVALTAWDYLSARWVDRPGVDVVLVGDSLAMVALGHSTTIPLTLEVILHHLQAVRRGVSQGLLVCDLPFLSYQISVEQALLSAGRLLQEGGAEAVKLEGGSAQMVATIDRLVQVGIPVMGHLGLTPQSVHQLGFRQQGQSQVDRDRILTEALALEAAGAFSIVLEHIPSDLGQLISEQLKIPTIGIGAGPNCDGQVLVTTDLLGMSDRLPPFAKVYAPLGEMAGETIDRFAEDVREGQFPAG
jgi:3-methyl-2-oxobutanoate hydroxymethyltransferase